MNLYAIQQELESIERYDVAERSERLRQLVLALTAEVAQLQSDLDNMRTQLYERGGFEP